MARIKSKDILRDIFLDLKHSGVGFIGLDDLEELSVKRLKKRYPRSHFLPDRWCLMRLANEQKLRSVRRRSLVQGYVFG